MIRAELVEQMNARRIEVDKQSLSGSAL